MTREILSLISGKSPILILSTRHRINKRQDNLVHHRIFTAQDISKNGSAHVLCHQQFQWQLQPGSHQTRKTCSDILKRGKKKTTGHDDVELETYQKETEKEKSETGDWLEDETRSKL